jgi:hypothetical protein
LQFGLKPWAFTSRLAIALAMMILPLPGPFIDWNFDFLTQVTIRGQVKNLVSFGLCLCIGPRPESV